MPFQRHSKPIMLWYSRLSFPKVWEPVRVKNAQGIETGTPAYRTLVVVAPAMVQKIIEIENELILQSWPEWGGLIPPMGVKLTRALVPGEVRRPDDPNLQGHMVMSANAKPESPPSIARKAPHLPSEVEYLTAELHRNEVYSGCEAHVGVGIYTTEMKVNEPQINVGLNNIILTGRQLPRFDGRVTVEAALKDGPGIEAPEYEVPAGAPGIAPPAYPPAGQPGAAGFVPAQQPGAPQGASTPPGVTPGMDLNDW